MEEESDEEKNKSSTKEISKIFLCDVQDEKGMSPKKKVYKASFKDEFLGNTKHLIGLPGIKKGRKRQTEEIFSVTSLEDSSLETYSGGSSEEESESDRFFKTYSRRYYIWTLFCMIMLVNTFLWNSLGPITPTIKNIFNWQDFHIGILSGVDSLVFLVSSVLILHLIDRSGVRPAVLLCCFSLVVTSVTRSIIFEDSNANFALLIVSQMFNGVASSFTQISISFISSLWFPVNQRATATATVCIFDSIGVSTSYILGPLLVGDPASINETNPLAALELRTKFLNYMRSLILFAVAVSFLAICYFPSAPPKPPTFSASMKKKRLVNFDFQNLLRNNNYLLIMFPVGIYTGVANSWVNILSLNLLEWRNMSAIKVGYLCFTSTLVGCFVSIIVSRMSDRYPTRKKSMSMTLFFISILGTIMLCSLTYLNFYPHLDQLIYVAVGIIIVPFQANLPLFYELIVEDAYPSDEGTATLVVIWCQNLVMVLFFSIFCVPNIDTKWMNWLLMGTSIICAVVMAFHKAKYRRTYVDRIGS